MLATDPARALRHAWIAAATAALALHCGAQAVTPGDAESGNDAPPSDTLDVPPADIADVPPPIDAPTCCMDQQNPTADYDESSGGASCAWQYVPTCNLHVRRIELHNRGGMVVIRSDDHGRPGAPLWQGTLPPSSTYAWLGVDVNPPLSLTAGQTYWIQEAAGVLSCAATGTQYPYYCEESAGWSGPYMWHAWMSRLYGTDCH